MPIYEGLRFNETNATADIHFDKARTIILKENEAPHAVPSPYRASLDESALEAQKAKAKNSELTTAVGGTITYDRALKQVGTGTAFVENKNDITTNGLSPDLAVKPAPSLGHAPSV